MQVEETAIGFVSLPSTPRWQGQVVMDARLLGERADTENMM
jgi:hypothetical protein